MLEVTKKDNMLVTRKIIIENNTYFLKNIFLFDLEVCIRQLSTIFDSVMLLQGKDFQN